MTADGKKLLIVDPLPATQDPDPVLSARRVPVEALRAGMAAVLSEVGEMFKDAQGVLGSCKVDHVEISLAISADGSIGLLGTALATGAKGAIKMKLVFPDQHVSS